MIVAIHQPNFFPWLGYFNKIARSDYFVFLDDAQFPKKKGTWINRVKLLVSGKPAWVTAPIKRDYHGTLKINEMSFDDHEDWRRKILKTLEMNYAKAEFFDENYEKVRNLIENRQGNIADYNISVIRNLSSYIGLGHKCLVRASEYSVSSTATQRLVDLVKAVGGNTYLSGNGAEGYQENDLYQEHHIKLEFQDFNHPTYLQVRSNEFHPGLSIIDALMNLGREKTARLFMSL